MSEPTNAQLSQQIDKLAAVVAAGFTEVNNKFSEVNERFDTMDTRSSEVSERLGRIEHQLTSRIENVDIDVIRLKRDMQRVKDKIGID